MPEDENNILEKPFTVEIAKQGRAVCKKCGQKCLQGNLRIAKIPNSSFGTCEKKNWYHVSCIFEMFLKQRQTTKRIQGAHDIEGWDSLNPEDQVDISKRIEDCNKIYENRLQSKSSKKSKNTSVAKVQPTLNFSTVSDDALSVSSDSVAKDGPHKDNCFREFRSIVANVSNASSSEERIGIFSDIFSKGSDGTGFKGDIKLWCKLLLPAVFRRVFHLQTKQLLKLFSKIFQINEEKMMKHLNQSDVGQAIQYFFEHNLQFKPQNKSNLTIQEVDDFLETLTTLSKEDDQLQHFKSFIKRCTGNDLKVVIRLIKHDLRMNAGSKHVFKGIHPNAYMIFQECRDIKSVINACWTGPLKKETKLIETKSPNKRSPKRKPSQESKQTPKKTRSDKSEMVLDENKAENGEQISKKVKKDELKVENSDIHVEQKEFCNEQSKILEPVVSVPQPDVILESSLLTSNDVVESVENQAIKLLYSDLPERRKSIPNYFENVKLLLEEGVPERHAQWVRYFIAYGGTVLKCDQYEQATHVLHLKDTISNPNILCMSSARHVIVEWIKDTVANECLQDFRPYSVRWNPSFKD